MQNPYAPHEDFIRAARAATRPGQVLTVVVVVAVAYYVISAVLYLILPRGLQEAVYEGSGRFAAFWNFAMVGLSCVILVRVLRRVHGRGFWSLIGDYRSAWDDWKRVFIGVGGVLTVVTLATGARRDPDAGDSGRGAVPGISAAAAWGVVAASAGLDDDPLGTVWCLALLERQQSD